jgi:hypothetical protein
MPHITANLSEIATISPEGLRELIGQMTNTQKAQLRGLLDEEFQSVTPPPGLPPAEFAAKWEQEQQWLQQHQQAYAGRWVALNGERLIATGDSAKEVYATLKASGISGTYVTRVAHPDDLPVIE